MRLRSIHPNVWCTHHGLAMRIWRVVPSMVSMIFAMSFANLIGLYFLAPGLREDLDVYWTRVRERRAAA